MNFQKEYTKLITALEKNLSKINDMQVEIKKLELENKNLNKTIKLYEQLETNLNQLNGKEEKQTFETNEY